MRRVRSKWSLWGAALLLTVAMVSLPATTHAEPKITLKLGHIGSTVAPYHRAMLHFAEEVAKKTGGDVKIDVYPASQLGSANKMIKGISAGTVDIVGESIGRFVAFDPGFKLLDLPFFLETSDQAIKVIESPLGQELLEHVRAKTGIILLNHNMRRLPRQLYTIGKPVFKPEDLKGMKIRVKKMKQFVLAWQRLGATPVVINYSELYTALSRKMVDAMEGLITAGWGKKFYEVLDYCTLIHYTHELHGIMVNEKKFKAMDPKYQKAMREAAVETGEYYSQLERKERSVAVRDYEKAGVAIIEVDTAPFRKLMEGLPEKLEAEGEWPKGLYARFKQALK